MIRKVWRAALLLAALLIALPAAAQEKRIAFSFDDVPRQPGGFMSPDTRAIALIAGLAEAGIEQAGFFITPGNLESDGGAGGEARIAAYVAAGHVIGNHSMTHRSLHAIGPEEFLADLDRAEAWLAGRPGHRPWFRYPYLHEGETVEDRDAVRAGLAERGLLNAYVTVDNWDWDIDDLATAAVTAGETLDMDGLRSLYVETLVDAAEFSDRNAREELGRSPAHVILLHETDLNALFVADLAQGLRDAGWTIITIDEAFADPIAMREPDTLYLGGGRVTALASEAGRDAASLSSYVTDEAELARRFNARVLHRDES